MQKKLYKVHPQTKGAKAFDDAVNKNRTKFLPVETQEYVHESKHMQHSDTTCSSYEKPAQIDDIGQGLY